METSSSYCVVHMLDCATNINTTVGRRSQFTNWIIPPLFQIAANCISQQTQLNQHLHHVLNNTTSEPIYSTLLARSLYNKNLEAVSIILQEWPWEELRLFISAQFDYMAIARVAGFTMDSVRNVLISLAGVFIEAIQYQRLKTLRVADISSARRYNIQWPMLVARMVMTATVSTDIEIQNSEVCEGYVLKVGEAFPPTAGCAYQILHEMVFCKTLFTRKENNCIGTLNISMLINSSLLEAYSHSKQTGRCMLSLHINHQSKLDENLTLLPTFNHISDELIIKSIDLTNHLEKLLSAIPRRLTKLSLNDVQMGVLDLKCIRKSFHRETLLKLELTANLDMTRGNEWLAYEGELIKLLENMPSLEVLVLKKCAIQASLGAKLFKTLVEHCKRLTLLDIFFSKIQADTVLEAGCLGSLPYFSVFCIDLPQTPMFKAAANRLRLALRENRIAFSSNSSIKYPNLDAAFWKKDYFEF